MRDTIAAAMQRYQVAARSVNPDSIAAFYAPAATLFEPGIKPIHTRDSIRAFIASFPGVRVDVATAAPDTIEVAGDIALFWGSYFERLAFPGQPVSEQRQVHCGVGASARRQMADPEVVQGADSHTGVGAWAVSALPRRSNSS